MMKILYIGNQLTKHGNTPTGIDVLGPLLEDENYHVQYSSDKKNKFFRFIQMFFNTLYYSKKVDIVLIDTYSTWNFWHALMVSQLCRLLRVPYVAILHGGRLPNRLKHYPKTSKMIFANSKYNVAPSNYLLNEFTNMGFTNTVYIPNPVKNKFQIYSPVFDYPRLIWVRSFSKLYNPMMAVHVFENIKEVYENATLTMVGPVKDHSFEEVRNYVEYKQLDVIFTGKISKLEWIELAKNKNVFINTAIIDNTPFSVLEAMSIGLPVISTNVGGIPFLIKHQYNGLLIESNDTLAMAQAIKKLFDGEINPDLLIQNALETTAQFDWEIVKISWDNLLKQ